MSKLITTSLISAVDWAMKSPPTWKDKAVEDLKNTLGRIYTPLPKEVQRGIDIEREINTCVLNPDSNLILPVLYEEVVKICKGAQVQKKSKSYITVENTPYCLYGKIDFAFPELLIDLKTTGDYKGQNKYLSTFQHKVYCFNEKIEYFKYLVLELDTEGKPVFLHKIDTGFSDFALLKDEIVNKIYEVMDYLKSDTELWNLYNTKFCLY